MYCHKAVSHKYRQSSCFKFTQKKKIIKNFKNYIYIPNERDGGNGGEDTLPSRVQEKETLRGTRIKREPVLIWVTQNLCFTLSKK